MNREIFVATLEQRLRSPVRLALAAAILLFAAVPYLLAILYRQTTGVVPSSHGGMLGLVFAAGVLGQEFSSGAPQITFTRPLARWVWVLSRALAVSALAAVVSLLPYGLALVATHAPGEVAMAALEQVLATIGTSAVLVGLSALVPGLTDLALIAGSKVGLGILAIVQQVAQKEDVKRAAEWIADHGAPWFEPKLELAPLLHGAGFSVHALLLFLSTVLFWFVVACAMVNRKELSYATD